MPVPLDEVVSLYRSGQSARAIAVRFNTNHRTILNKLIDADVQRRPASQKGRQPPNRRTDITVEAVTSLYRAGLSIARICKRLNTSPKVVSNRLKQAGEPPKTRRDYPPLKGSDLPHWKGGRVLNAGGYVVLSGNGKQWYEHRSVVEAHIGRKLHSREVIHHLNGIRTDNRLENLQITNCHEHESRTLVKALQRRIRELESQLQPSK